MLDAAQETCGSADRGEAREGAAVATIAPDGTMVRASAGFLRLFGYEAREVVGRPHRMFVPGEAAAQKASDDLWDALRRGECRTAECRRRHKDGSDLWVEATYTALFDLEDRPFEIVMAVVDATAHKLSAADERGQILAVNRSQAVVHYSLDGLVTNASDLFLQAMGYRLDEVWGRHHSMFVPAAHAASPDYAAFWGQLAKGGRHAGEFTLLDKGGREVVFRATYDPILDTDGRPFKVVTYGTDITGETLRLADYEGQVAAIHKSQGVITFDMNGIILDVNDHFLEAVGYRLDEVRGRHHRMFVDPAYAHGPEYATFWHHLSQGRHRSGEYRRFGKGGREVWLQATYNPVLDLSGRPVKVVKFATVTTREKLRQADIQGQIASIHKSQCVISFDLDGLILDANDNFLAVTGYRLSEIRGLHHRIFVEEATAESRDYATFWQELAQGRHQAAEYKRVCKDGREIWLQASYNPIFDMNGRPFKVVKYATDITAERLRQADYEGQIAAIQKSQCVVAFAMDGTILDANDNFLRAMGYPLAEVKGCHHHIFIEPGSPDDEGYAAFWDTLRAGAFMSGKFKRLGKNGREVWIQASYNPIFDLNGKPFKVIKIATDVTADVALAANFIDAKRQAEHDAATALPNRVRLASFMTAALATPEARLAILYLDLDHFKPINDSFGHQVGDHVLSETADRLRRVLRPDQLVARIGGDEFVVAAPNLSDDQIEDLCRRLIGVVTAPIRHEKGVLNVGLSIGVASSPEDAATADDLLRCADVALYRTKGNGRGSYSFFTRAADERIAADRHLAEDMRHGIKAGQFFLEFQPRLDVRSRRVEGVEALVRWAHPERGAIKPSDFVPLAEKSGLIVPLGIWVLRTACHMAMAWPGVGLSVAISAVQFRGTDLVAIVGGILDETGLAAGRLELEIAEDVLGEDEVRARAVLEALKASGVRLSLAGFGTGSTTLSRLRSFPFDVIKIDRRFIAGLDRQDGGQAIVRSILRIGGVLGLSFDAGIETEGHVLRLSLAEGADIQGFLLSQPVPSDAVPSLLAAHHLVLAAAE